MNDPMPDRHEQQVDAYCKGAKQERDKIARWLRARSQSLHTEFQSDPLIRTGRDSVSNVLIGIASEIEAGAGKTFTPRNT